MKKKFIFDKLYSSFNCLFGLQADKFLVENLKNLHIENAIDLGCGEGRHTLYLAQEGIHVKAIDKSRKAIEKLCLLSKKFKLFNMIEPTIDDILEINLKENFYDLCILSFVLPFFSRSQVLKIIEKIKLILKKDGFIYISALTTEDPDYFILKTKYKEIEPQTIWNENLQCFQFWFRPLELLNLFSDFEIIDYKETVIPFPRPPGKHAMCLLFAKKINNI